MTDAEQVDRVARPKGQQVEQSEVSSTISSRAGLVAYGVVHLLLAWLTIQLALGDHNEEASASGAITQSSRSNRSARCWSGRLRWGCCCSSCGGVTEAAFGHREHEGSTRTRLRLASAGEGRRVRRAGRDRRPGGGGLRELQQLFQELARDDGEGDGPARRSVDRGGHRSRGHRVRRGRDRPARLAGGVRRGAPDRGQAGLERGGVPAGSARSATSPRASS